LRLICSKAEGARGQVTHTLTDSVRENTRAFDNLSIQTISKNKTNKNKQTFTY